MNKTVVAGLMGTAFGILLGFIGTGLILLLSRPPKGTAIVLQPLPPSEIKIVVQGAIQKPGMYTLEEYSRIEDALSAAGGFAAGADKDAINLAAYVEDGMQIKVPFKEATTRQEASSTKKPTPHQETPAMTEEVHPLVNINTATLEELIALPHIGEVTAQKIIQYRQAYGLFQNLEELKNVSGIGEATFEKIKPYITIQS